MAKSKTYTPTYYETMGRKLIQILDEASGVAVNDHEWALRDTLARLRELKRQLVDSNTRLESAEKISHTNRKEANEHYANYTKLFDENRKLKRLLGLATAMIAELGKEPP